MSFVSGEVAGGNLLIDIALSGDGKAFHPFVAKIDTGAHITATSQHILDNLKCEGFSMRDIITASGVVQTYSHLATIGIYSADNKISHPREVKIVSLPLRANYDILLGMDILMHCCFICKGNAFFLGFDGNDKKTLKAATSFINR